MFIFDSSGNPSMTEAILRRVGLGVDQEDQPISPQGILSPETTREEGQISYCAQLLVMSGQQKRSTIKGAGDAKGLLKSPRLIA